VYIEAAGRVSRNLILSDDVAGRSSLELADGQRLSYLTWGDPEAPPLVLLHGGACAAADWQQVAPALAETRYVVAPDLRGCGESDWDPQLRYGVRQMVDDTRELAARLGLGRFHLVGHSLGAVAAIVHAAEHPEELRRVVLEDGGPADRTRPPRLESTPALFADAEQALAWLHVPAWVVGTRLRPAGGRLEWRADMEGRKRWADAGGEPLLPVLWPFVERVSVPALLVRGALSQPFPRETAERMVELNPRIRLVEIAGAGHLVHYEQPDAFLAEVQAFL
jgi:pimeloyl-ACP methyl ester carboxylesterase